MSSDSEAADAVWPFTSSPNTSCITLRGIINGGAPILFASHDEEDGGYQFLDGSESPSIDDAMVVSLGFMLHRDPSIAALSSLPIGWIAGRKSADAEWTWQKHPDKADH